jgi:ubiquinone/menaquinone biosynthesis C-methylase UbiE
MYNEARKKVQYDLDYLGIEFKLPFKDHSFDSATMISVWQYLENPVAVLKELERVLVPGGEVYVINGDGAGVEGLVKNASRSEDIRKIARKCGYDTLLQTIPGMNGKRDTFKSVCIAMPGNTLFGPHSHVYQKRGKVWAVGTSRQFLDNYAEWELRKIMERLSQLKAYPITEYSLNYLETCERISQRFHEKTGKFPVLYAESHQLEVDMYVKGGFIMSHELAMEDMGSKDSFGEFVRSLGMNPGFGQNYASIREYVRMHIEGKDGLPKVKDYEDCGFEWHDSSVQERKNAIHSLANFIASVPLNSYTKGLQQSLLERLEKEEPSIRENIARAKARRLYYLCCEYKQRRGIDKLIELKKRLKDIEIAKEAALDFGREISHFRGLILQVPMGYDDSGMD